MRHDFFDEAADMDENRFNLPARESMRAPFEVRSRLGGSARPASSCTGHDPCAAAAMAARADARAADAAADEDDGTGRSAEAKDTLRATAGELAALLRRVAAHSEIAADGVRGIAQYRGGARASGVVSARAGAA